MKVQRYLMLAPILLCCLACGRSSTMSKPLNPFTKAVMLDTENRYHGMMESLHATPDGEIVIIGDERGVINLVSMFVLEDRVDNGNSAAQPDFLPDFAGESFCCIIDTLNFPIKDIDSDKLCEVLVRHVIAATDSTVHVSPFDLEGIGSKAPAKMIIVTDPVMAHAGIADADSLLRHFKCGIPVIAPMDAMFDIFAEDEPDARIVGILCGKEAAEAGIYSDRLGKACLRRGHPAVECVVFPIEDTGSPLRAFLDKFVQYSGGSKKLDAILVDACELDFGNIKSEMADLLSLMNEESMIYRPYVSDNFRLMESYDCAVEKCYSILRETNMFSHNISAPSVGVYFNIPSLSDNDGSYILIPGTYVQN